MPLAKEDLVLSATAWESNAAMIADMALKLHYLNVHDHVIDPTFGKGNWWTQWKPAHLTIHDIKIDGVDFRHLPEHDSVFDAAVFDPSYVSPGGRATSTIPVFNSAYGIDACPRTPRGLQDMNNAGLLELGRVVKPRGYILTKCMAYVSSGKLFDGREEIKRAGIDAGMIVWDEFVHLGGIGPQPARDVQQHGRSNFSNLVVFRNHRD